MNRIWLALAIVCLAVTGTAQAEGWGRIFPHSLISQTKEDAGTAQDPAAAQPNVQAPTAEELKGYPFESRCGCDANRCCAGIWDGYSRSCGCGHARGCLGHLHRHSGCGLQHSNGCGSNVGCSTCSTGCGCAGGSFNSFAGGGCNGCGGGIRGLGWHACGLQAFGGCGCGGGKHFHHLHGLWHACGLGCNTGCDMNGCNSCNGDSHKQGETVKQIMNPPVAPSEPTPVVEQGATGSVPVNEKSAFRPWSPTAPRRFPAGF